ncbi:Cationic amino acid transporter 3 [Vulpes lagopus]
MFIVISLLICILVYFGVFSALVLMVPYYQLQPGSTLPKAFLHTGWAPAHYAVTFAFFCSISVSLLDYMFPIRQLISMMAHYGLFFPVLARIQTSIYTSIVATVIFGIIAGIMVLFFGFANLLDLMSVGAPLVYSLLAFSVLILRYEPQRRNGGNEAQVQEENEAEMQEENEENEAEVGEDQTCSREADYRDYFFQAAPPPLHSLAGLSMFLLLTACSAADSSLLGASAGPVARSAFWRPSVDHSGCAAPGAHHCDHWGHLETATELHSPSLQGIWSASPSTPEYLSQCLFYGADDSWHLGPIWCLDADWVCYLPAYVIQQHLVP